MGRFINLINRRFGRLFVVSETEKKRAGNIVWLCKCDCGNIKEIVSYDMISGHTKSCGCYRDEKIGKLNLSHKMTGLRPWNVWVSMKQRCQNSNSQAYKYYGGRGIKVCERWNKFENFWLDMKQEYKKNLTLDRIDNNKGYSKENCRWATRMQQSENKRNNIFITYKGKTKSIKEWASDIGIEYKAFHYRINHGWTIEKAITTPHQSILWQQLKFGAPQMASMQ